MLAYFNNCFIGDSLTPDDPKLDEDLRDMIDEIGSDYSQVAVSLEKVPQMNMEEPNSQVAH